MVKWFLRAHHHSDTIREMTTDLSNLDDLEYLARRDPSELGYPPMLPVELALRIETPAKICAIYGITRDEFVTIVKHPVFVKAYQEAVESLKVSGMSFKLKAQMQAEGYLATAYAMIQDKNTADSVRADLLKSTVRWAGYDAKAAEANTGGNFSIQINLG